jgi:hypothetical protein
MKTIITIITLILFLSGCQHGQNSYSRNYNQPVSQVWQDFNKKFGSGNMYDARQKDSERNRLDAISYSNFFIDSFSGGATDSTMCPDGSYVSGPSCTLCPNGQYVAGRCSLMPNGQYIGR